MIPYVPQPVWNIGGFEIHAFGIAAAAALNTGWLIVFFRARAQRLQPMLATGLYLMIAVAGLAGGRVFSTRGESAEGLAIGGSAAVVAAYFFLRRRVRAPWPYFDVLAFAFPFVWSIVRAGCALAHDHIGRASASILTVHFPGGPRFDLGLLECIAAALVSFAFLVLDARGFRRFLPLALIAGGLTRLALIPFREATPRGEVALFGAAALVGFVLAFRGTN